MSIFTHTFPDYVKKQLQLREAILSHGDTKTNRFSRHKELGKRLPAGAFYTNTTERQCILRLYSGVDLNERGNDKVLKGWEKSKWKTEELARNWILEGGVRFSGLKGENGNIPEGQREGFIKRKKVNEDGTPSLSNSGIINQTSIGTAYGDPWTRSDADDNFGPVPMPGIINAEIKTKSAYGSLKEAKISFVCHNQRQLEILELLYMRPGYTMMLEWGWLPYIGNNGKKETIFPIMNKFFKTGTKFSDLNNLITDRIQESSGNYDAMVGYCKNFEMKSREDGGYDCSTTIIAMGEVLEQIKGRRDFEPLKLNENNDEILFDNFQVYMEALKQKMAQEKTPGMNADDEKIDLWALTGTAKQQDMRSAEDTYEMLTPDNDHNLNYQLDKAFKEILELKHLKIYESKDPTQDGGEDSKVPTQDYKALDDFFIHKGEPLGTLAINGDGMDEVPLSQFNYIRWDLLCEIINNFCLETNIEDQVVSYSYTNNIQASNQDNNDYIEYSNYKFEPQTTIYLRTDWDGNTIADVDLPENQDSNSDQEGNDGDGGTLSVNIDSLVDGSMNPKIALLPHQIKHLQSKVKGKDYLFGKTHFVSPDGGAPKATQKSIGLIFLNLDHILEKYKKMAFDENGGEKEGWSLFNFIKEIWEEDVTNACAGTHKFILHCPNNIARVIDVSYGGGLSKQSLYPFRIQDKNSIVRDFNFHTTIDKKLSSTISIAAQSPQSISSLDQLSFESFNKNIKNRFIEVKGPDKEKLLESRQKLEKNTNKIAAEIYNHKRNMIGGLDDTNVKTVSNAVQKAKKLEKNILKLCMTYSQADEESGKIKEDSAVYGDDLCVGAPKLDINLPKSSIIPLKFNAKTDGIGGIVIGNVFRVQESKLPEGYKGDDIAFAVMSIGHKITEGQDWTTEIGGQLLLLDRPFEGGKSTTFSLGSMGLSRQEAIDYTHKNMAINPYRGNVSDRTPRIDGTDYLYEYANAQGPEADFWTLVAICITEAYAPGKNFSNAQFQQACCDIAQSIFNRYQIDHFLSTKIVMNEYLSADGYPERVYFPSYYAKTAVGDSLKSIMIAPEETWYDLDGQSNSGGMGIKAYEVTYQSNAVWSAIKDYETSKEAVYAYYEAKGQTYKGLANEIDRRMKLCTNGFKNKDMMENARILLEGRGDYRGTGIDITSDHPFVTAAIKEDQVDGSNNVIRTMVELREVKLRDPKTSNKFYHGYHNLQVKLGGLFGLKMGNAGALDAGPIPESIKSYF